MSQQQQQTSQRYLARFVSSIVLGLTLGLSLAFAQPPGPEVAPNPDELYFRDEITLSYQYIVYIRHLFV
jgi:hypothetical protein